MANLPTDIAPARSLRSASRTLSGNLLFRLQYLAFAVCLLIGMPAGCASLPAYTLSPLPPGAVELPFETLSLTEQGWRSNGSTIGVIAASGEADQWQSQVSPSIFSSLKAVNYAENLVILVNRGESQCLPLERSEILQIVRQGRRIQVFANFPEYPLFGWSRPCPAILVYPHHIVVVPKRGTWQDTFTFDLMVGSRVAATAEQWIP